MSAFWRNWLNLWCWAVAAFGLLLIGAGFPATSGPTEALIAQLHSGGALEFDAPLHFSFGLMGALTLGLALLVATGARAADALGPRGRPIWSMLTTSLLAWYVIDSIISIANGFALNAVSNTLLMITFLAPILASGVLRQPATA
nr:hypothetical protein [Polymorphobacter sp.]